MPPDGSRDKDLWRRAVSRALAAYRSGKRTVFAKTRLGYERSKQFLRLPGCYRRVMAVEDRSASGPAVARDLLIWFFSYRTFPDHYGLCRLWEVDKRDWPYYFGSNYHPQRVARLKKSVQPLEYRVLFNDKYICSLLCRALGIPIPRTHGVLDPARGHRPKIAEWLAASAAGRLVIKPLMGEMGRDIVMAEPGAKGPVIRTPQGLVPLADFDLTEKAVVQDVLTQDPRMAAFSSSSVNTLRVVTMMTRRGEVLIVNASFRSGVGGAFVDNWSAGGVSVGVDCARGVLKRFAYDKKSRRYEAHPTSGIVFERHPVPGWDRVRALAEKVQTAFAFYRLLGLDIALDAKGDPVLIEANGAPDLAGLEQKAGPLLKREAVLRAFGEDDLLFNRHQRRLYAALLERDPASGGTA